MTQFKLVEPEDTKKRAYRTDEPVYAYIRFSTMEQVKNSLQSKKMQDDNMRRKLERIGFKDIRVKDKDEGISGQKGRDKRLDLDDIYRAMDSGICGAIAAHDASRMWRDRDHVFYNDFILRLKKHNVPFITYTKTYWPDNKADMDSLREEFKYAQKQLDQNYEKTNPARQEAVLSGSYGGHSVPMGYVVVGEKGSKHYIIYEPHAKLIRWLFLRYRQLNGNLGRLGRELVAMDFHFPDFDREALRALGAEVPHVALIHDAKGYRLQTRNGLISVLTNRAYIGWYVWNAVSEESRVFTGEYINKEAHTAIVDMDDFMFAYSQRSNKTLDGEPNESKPTIDRHYSRVNALLEGKLTSGKAPMYAVNTGDYAGKLKSDGWKNTVLVVSIQQIDSAFSKAMIAMLAAMELKKLRRIDKSLTEKIDALKAEKEESATSLTEQLATIDKGIRQWEVAKQAAMAEESVPDTIEAIRNLKRLRADREAIEAKANAASKEVDQLSECCNLLDCATKDWYSWKFEKQQRLVRLIVEHATIEEVSPHMLKLVVLFSEPVNTVITFHIYRARGSKPVYTPEENATLRRLYPTTDRAIVLEKVPSRTWESIIIQATTELHLERSTRANTSDIPKNLTYSDAQLLRSLGLPVQPLNQPVWTIETDDNQLRSVRKQMLMK